MADKKPYHHRNLPDALRAVTADLVSERGPSGFSLREVARRAGVSHAAPAHHFGDTRGLLTSLATEGFERLATALGDAAERGGDAADRLRRCGAAYVETALDSPGHFAVIFRDDLLDTDDPALAEHGAVAFGHLIAAVEAVRDEINPDLDIDAAATMCWATMQGLVTLAPTIDKMVGSDESPDLEESIGSLCGLMLDGFRPRPAR
ncbi:MAG: TetR/AcrR family transcriptional regulator [Ilumatobacter sp.]